MCPDIDMIESCRSNLLLILPLLGFCNRLLLLATYFQHREKSMVACWPLAIYSPNLQTVILSANCHAFENCYSDFMRSISLWFSDNPKFCSVNIWNSTVAGSNYFFKCFIFLLLVNDIFLPCFPLLFVSGRDFCENVEFPKFAPHRNLRNSTRVVVNMVACSNNYRSSITYPLLFIFHLVLFLLLEFYKFLAGIFSSDQRPMNSLLQIDIREWVN